jgi:hypothetical protein
MREAVEKTAYLLWEQAGRPEGSADLDWEIAERMLKIWVMDEWRYGGYSVPNSLSRWMHDLERTNP